MQTIDVQIISDHKNLLLEYCGEVIAIFPIQFFSKLTSSIFNLPSKEEAILKANELLTKKAKELCYKWLAQKAFFIEELAKKLRELSFSEEIILGVLGELEQKKYLDDEHRLEMLIRKVVQLRKGPLYLLQVLKQKNVQLGRINLYDLYPEETEAEVLKQLFLSYKKKGRNQWIRFLLQRGFRLETIQKNSTAFPCA